MRQVLPVTFLLSCLGIAACSGLPAIQQPVAKFSVAAQQVASTEDAYIEAVRASDEKVQYYNNLKLYVMNLQTPKFETTNNSTISDSDLKLREDLLNTISIYGAKLAALTNSDATKSLDKNVTSLAIDLKSIDKNAFTALDKTVDTNAVVTAVVAIADFVIDREIYKEVKASALAMDPYLGTVADTLKEENKLFARKLQNNAKQIDGRMTTIAARANEVEPHSIVARTTLYQNLMRTTRPFLRGTKSQLMQLWMR